MYTATLAFPDSWLDTDPDLSRSVQMMHPIGQIIGHDLLDLEFIPQHPQLLRRLHLHVGVVLLDQDAAKRLTRSRISSARSKGSIAGMSLPNSSAVSVSSWRTILFILLASSMMTSQ